jgi:MFS family permease
MLERNVVAEATKSSRGSIAGAIAASFAFVMELTLVPLLLPAIQAQLQLSLGELAWVFNSYGIAVALGVLIGGWLGDVLGIGKVFISGVIFFALGALTVALSTSLESIVAGRVLQGFGGGIFSPLVPLLLTRASPLRPGRVLILWGSVNGYVAALAPLLFSHAMIGNGWQLAFVVFALVSVCALVTVHTTNGDHMAHRVQTPRKFKTVLQSRALLLMIGYVFCTYGSITYYLFRLPLWLSENNYETVNIGFILFAVWISFSIVSTLLRNWVDGPRVRSILIAAPLLIATGFLLMVSADALLVFAFSAVLIGSGLACSNAPSTQMILEFAPKGMNAISTSLDITFARLGGVITVAWLAQADFDSSVLAVTLLCLFAILCAGGCFRAIKSET